MKNNKIATYLLYAIGEIFLVVVGILIAVQIDNWNEANKLKRIETQYLNEIKKGLEIDIQNANRVLQYNTDKANTLDSMLFVMQNRNYKEMLQALTPLMHATFSFDQLILKRVAFDNMIAAESIAIISNNELRDALTEYYLFDSPTQERVKQVSRDYTEAVTNALISRELIIQYLNYDLPLPSINSTKVNEDPNVVNKIFSVLETNKIQNQLVQTKKMEAEGLINQIDSILQIH